MSIIMHICILLNMCEWYLYNYMAFTISSDFLQNMIVLHNKQTVFYNWKGCSKADLGMI